MRVAVCSPYFDTGAGEIGDVLLLATPRARECERGRSSSELSVVFPELSVVFPDLSSELSVLLSPVADVSLDSEDSLLKARSAEPLHAQGDDTIPHMAAASLREILQRSANVCVYCLAATPAI